MTDKLKEENLDIDIMDPQPVSSHQQNQELALINHACQIVNSGLDLPTVLKTILEEMHQLMDIVATSLWLHLPETDELICQQATGPGSDKLISWRLAPGQGLTGHAAQIGQPLIVFDTQTETHHFKEVDRKIGLDVRSMLNIPLRAQGELIGVLNLVDTNVGRFSEDDVRLLEPIVTIAANAIQNARLFDEVQHHRQLAEQRVEELSILNQITQTLATVTHLSSALEFIAEVVTHCFNGFSTGISLFNEARTQRTIVVMHQVQNINGFELVGRVIPLTNDKTYTQYISKGKSLVITDPQTNPLTKNSHASIRARNLQCLMLIPLQTHGEIIGTISVSTNQVGRVFTADEVSLAETIAGQIAGAVEVARLFEEEQHQRQLAENRNQELDAFASTVAHDLKNPLSIVGNYAEFLLKDDEQFEAAELSEIFKNIYRSVHKALNIIDELLLLAGVRKRTVPISPLNMAQVVAQAQERLAFMIQDYQAKILLPKSWPVAKGYAPWVEEVWMNYLNNGLKYGGHPPRLELGFTSQADGMIRFWIQDNGPGLTPEAQAKLFTEFTRLDEVRAEGHGLGLSIVHRIVEKLGGQVGVDSSGPEKGSTFYFTLPAVEINDQP